MGQLFLVLIGAMLGFTICSLMAINKDTSFEADSIKKEVLHLTSHVAGLKTTIEILTDKLEIGIKELNDRLKGIDENVEQIYGFTENTKVMTEEIKYHITDDGQNFEAIKSDLATITEDVKVIRTLKRDLNKAVNILDCKFKGYTDESKLLMCRQVNNLSNQIGMRRKRRK